jgi:two-component system chemotaxis response regulator CheB
LLGKIKVLVVDDSSYVVTAVSHKLESCPDIEVIGSARNGIEAIEKVKSLQPDVVTLDIVMPEMDGLTALEHIIAECPVPVIMLSALTSENADTTIKALELGAVDFFLKPSIVDPAGNGTVAAALIEKVKTAAKLNGLVKKLSARFKTDVDQTKVSIPHLNGLLVDNVNRIVVIGSSTGGPRALMQLIPGLPQDLPAAVLLVQHMPPLFTKSLAQRLAQSSKIRVKEADADSVLMNGQVLLAPGDYHMVINEEKKINLIQSPPVQGVRPSVDVTMKSVAKVFKAATLGVILTGMGCDGTEGASHIKASGGTILAEDESTCAVYGMPMSVTKAGYTDRVVPLQSMAPLITRLCKEKTKNKVEEFACEL